MPVLRRAVPRIERQTQGLCVLPCHVEGHARPDLRHVPRGDVRDYLEPRATKNSCKQRCICARDLTGSHGGASGARGNAPDARARRLNVRVDDPERRDRVRLGVLQAAMREIPCRSGQNALGTSGSPQKRPGASRNGRGNARNDQGSCRSGRGSAAMAADRVAIVADRLAMDAFTLQVDRRACAMPTKPQKSKGL